MTDLTKVEYDALSGRTRFANYRDGKLVSLYWRENPGQNKRIRRNVGRKPMLDQESQDSMH